MVFNVVRSYVNSPPRVHTTAFLKVARKEALLTVDFQTNSMKPGHTLVSIPLGDDNIISVDADMPRGSQ
jgi:hypothetical protein